MPPLDASQDGRVQRGARNRDRIVEAVIALVRSGSPQPSAQAVAAASGTGKRTVFRQFRDMESLFRAVDARIQAEVVPLVDRSPIVGTLPERATELVTRRARLYEHVLPFRVSGMMHRRTSLTIRRGERALDQWARAQLRTTFAPELGAAPAELLEALDALTSIETWDRLRHAQRLGSPRAAAAVVAGVVGLLGGAAAGTPRPSRRP